MNRNLLMGVSAIALAAVALPAFAADIPVKAPPMVAATLYNWAGCYIGVHGGYAWGRKRVFDVDGEEIDDFRHNVDGGFVGGQVGCNVQRDRWVFGIEGQAAWANIRGAWNFTGFATGPTTIGFRTHADILGSIAVRLGFAFGANGQTMIFGKIGTAFIQERFSEPNFIAALSLQSERDLRWGLMLGLGIAHGLTPNTDIKFEYNANFFGTKNVALCEAGPDPFCETYRIRQHIHLVKVGFNYRFGSSPVVASRY